MGLRLTSCAWSACQENINLSDRTVALTETLKLIGLSVMLLQVTCFSKTDIVPRGVPLPALRSLTLTRLGARHPVRPLLARQARGAAADTPRHELQGPVTAKTLQRAVPEL